MKLRIRPANWVCAIFVFDCAVMPVIKIFGMSVKISYGIAFLSIMVLLIELLQRGKIALGSARPVLSSLVLYGVLICFGEMWSVLVYDVSVRTSLFKILIGIVLMVGSLYYGYNCKGNIGSAAYWCFVANVIINCILSLMGRAAPAIITKLYSVSLETFMDGYYRNGGIIGNPNATLLVTNMILMLVVLLYRYDKIELSNIKLASLYLLSVAADIIVSSRGELLNTFLILAYLTYWVAKKNSDAGNLLRKMVGITVIIVLIVGLFWNGIVERFPNIQQSVERMTTMESALDPSEEGGELSSIERPLYKFDVFWSRFRHSPIWGTGIDGNGNISDFQKGTTGYHNDFFMILGATGILGLLLWIKIIKKAIAKVGICMLFPLMTSAISNTFIQSYFATMLYFFIIGYVLCIKDDEEKEYVPIGKEGEPAVGSSGNW